LDKEATLRCLEAAEADSADVGMAGAAAQAGGAPSTTRTIGQGN